MVAGISNELYWDLTLREVEAVLDRVAEREQALNLRAGLVAATVINVKKKKGSPLVRAGDFFKKRQDKEYMSPAEAHRFMGRWMEKQNKHANRDTK